ncbi:MAG: N-acetyl-alpha-D-glucosaminyl L-malate synthase BshA [Bacillaceae bacterium]|nr:N-acetyl-alpha-D-glucosaminyl L-malate synthase BshA [Bacillaceae bacterium]
MKIGMTCYPSLGGSGVVATELGKLLAERGHVVHFITSDIPFRLGKYYRNIFFHDVEVNSYSVFRHPPYDLTLASRMAQVARRENLDVLHVHYAVPHAISAYLAKQMVGDHLKIVTTLHGTDITVLGYDQGLADIIRFGIEQSDAVTAVSRDLIGQTRELLDIKRDIELIYNFVDHREYYPRNVEHLKKDYANQGEKIFIHISNFRPVKRVLDVVRIFDRVHSKLPSKLLLIGEGPDKQKACQLVKELGLTDDVYFLGKQNDIAAVISVADLLILTSEKESFGLVALEAMACGVPVIATTAGGLPEVVRDGETGFLKPVGDIEGMASKVLELMQDETRYRTFAEQSIRHAHHTFNHDKITSQYEELYRRIQQTSRIKS